MKLPAPVTAVYVDWVEYKKYLETAHKKAFKKHSDDLWEFFCDGDLHNGCFVHIEPAEVMGYDPDAAITWFADRIFEDYGGTIATTSPTIKLWVWW